MEEVWIVNAIYSYVNAACVLRQLSNVTQDARPMEHARSIAFTLLMRMRSTISIMGKVRHSGSCHGTPWLTKMILKCGSSLCEGRDLRDEKLCCAI